MFKIYTDGSCIHNANITKIAIGPGGWAYALYNNDTLVFKHSGSAQNTTNGRMEVMAAHEAIRFIASNPQLTNPNSIGHPGGFEIISDSKYVIDGLNSWLDGWAKKNFSGIKHPDLWKNMYHLIHNDLKALKITGVWVKGHNGDEGNEVVNSLAQEAAYSIKGL